VAVLERVKFRLAVLVYRAVNGAAPRYLSEQLIRVRDMQSQTRLRSSSFGQLAVRPVASRNCCRLIICYCGSLALEQSTRGHYNCIITDNIST